MNYQFWPEISLYLDEIRKEKEVLRRDDLNIDMMGEVRENINHYLEQLKLSFEQSLDKQYASLALFAIVAYVDEDIQRQLVETRKGSWNPLQKDFYGAHNAGEVFFETIDKIIDNPEVPPIVLEVYYFMLNKGFLGKYRDSKTHIAKYLDLLKDKIPVITPVQEGASGSKEMETKKYRIKKWHYYACAGALSICVLCLLYFTSSH